MSIGILLKLMEFDYIGFYTADIADKEILWSSGIYNYIMLTLNVCKQLCLINITCMKSLYVKIIKG